jgi:hypothetical protein
MFIFTHSTCISRLPQRNLSCFTFLQKCDSEAKHCVQLVSGDKLNLNNENIKCYNLHQTMAVTRRWNSGCLYCRQDKLPTENAAAVVAKKSRFRTEHSTPSPLQSRLFFPLIVGAGRISHSRIGFTIRTQAESSGGFQATWRSTGLVNSFSGPLHLVELKSLSGFAGYNYEYIQSVERRQLEEELFLLDSSERLPRTDWIGVNR